MRVTPLMLIASLSICMFVYTRVDAAEVRFDAQFVRNPPRAQRATVEPLTNPTISGNAILRVHFNDARVKESIAVRNGRNTTVLRDDGIAPDEKARDGMHTAIVNINVEQYAVEQRRRLRLAERVKTVPFFEVREQAGTKLFQPSTLVQLKPGQSAVIDDFQGVPNDVEPGRELLITHASVVEDSERTYDACTDAGTQMGAWTFGRLMTEMANQPATGMKPGDFAEHWVEQWLQDLTINSFNVTNAAEGAQALLDQWPRLPNGRLDVSRAPFRLLAIINRLDLRDSTLYGSAANAGEVRFAFGFLNCELDPKLGPEVMEATVILEYGVDKQSCFAVRDWAQQWTALGDLPLGSAQYTAALQAITDQVTLSNADPNQHPNGSAINQVRTNEKAFLHDGWQFRESKLCTTNACSGQLENTTVAQTPDRMFIFTDTLKNFINGHELSILNGSHFVPLSYPLGSPFRGGFIHEDNNWDVPGGSVDPEALLRLGRATCNGCHDLAPNFLHIANRSAGAPAALSDFLTDDLVQRQMHLDATANMTCMGAEDFALEEIFIPPLPGAFVH